jgi:predicted nucleotidyltransferase
MNPVLKIYIKFYYLFLDQQCGCMTLFVPTGSTVEPFGSFVSNLFTRWGDLDISIVLSNGSYISSAGKKRKQNLLEDVLKALRQRGELLHGFPSCFLIRTSCRHSWAIYEIHITMFPILQLAINKTSMLLIFLHLSLFESFNYQSFALS